MTTPDARPVRCAVLGHPVAHSLSPAIHNAALSHDGRDASYVAVDVTPGELAGAIRELAGSGAIGVNVTIPHKAAALELAHGASETARRIGAANTLLFSGGEVRAHNTDAEGVLAALADLGVDPSGARCLIVGAGGAGRAAAWAVAEAGAASIGIANRTPERAATLAGAIDGATQVPWEHVREAASSSEVVVHATSLGLAGEAGPLDPAALHGAAAGACRVVLDLVYARGETELVRHARDAGLLADDGLGMLVHQAAAAYRLFWGADAPLAVMREAANAAAGRPPAV